MSPSQNGTHGAEEPPIIYTTDEEGVEHCFQMIDMIEVDNQLYGLLLYLGEQEALKKEESDDEGYDEEFVIMRIVEENGEQIFESIEDDAEFERVVAFVEQMEDDDEEE